MRVEPRLSWPVKKFGLGQVALTLIFGAWICVANQKAYSPASRLASQLDSELCAASGTSLETEGLRTQLNELVRLNHLASGVPYQVLFNDVKAQQLLIAQRALELGLVKFARKTLSRQSSASGSQPETQALLAFAELIDARESPASGEKLRHLKSALREIDDAYRVAPHSAMVLRERFRILSHLPRFFAQDAALGETLSQLSLLRERKQISDLQWQEILAMIEPYLRAKEPSRLESFGLKISKGDRP